MSRFHPSPALLATYAAGDLQTAASAPVMAHLERCDACQDRLSLLDEKHAALMAAAEPAVLDPVALDKVLARLDSPEAGHVEVVGDPAIYPAVIRRFGLGPKRHLAPGLWAAHLDAPRTGDWRAFVIQIPAGATIPHHGHKGGELVAVLEGAFCDRETYRQGDFVENLSANDHHLKVTPDAACTCLIAVQGALLWQGWARIIGPALGI